jgi:hypothetical protein
MNQFGPRNEFENSYEAVEKPASTITFVNLEKRDPLEEFREWEACFDRIYEMWQTDSERSSEEAGVVLGMRSMGNSVSFTEEAAASFVKHLPAGTPTMMVHAFTNPLFLAAVCLVGGELLNIHEHEKETPEMRAVWEHLESNKDMPAVQCLIKWGLDKQEDGDKQKALSEMLKANRVE